MPRPNMQSAYELIGRYVVTAILIGWLMTNNAPEVPLWVAFPLTTIVMILRGELTSRTTHRK